MNSAETGKTVETMLPDPNIEIVQGDCLDILPIYQENSIDLIITDPPYGFTYQTWRPKRKRINDQPILNDDENYYDVLDKMLNESSRVLKDGGAIYIFCGYQMIEGFVKLVKKYFNYKNILIWVKNNWTAGDLKGNYGTKTEYIIYATKGRHLLNGRRDHNVLEYKRIPPTQAYFKFQKPTDLLEFLVKKSSDEGDMILDPFMGSASTLVACHNLNRKCIGIEADTNVFCIAKERLENELT